MQRTLSSNNKALNLLGHVYSSWVRRLEIMWSKNNLLFRHRRLNSKTTLPQCPNELAKIGETMILSYTSQTQRRHYCIITAIKDTEEGLLN